MPEDLTSRTGQSHVEPLNTFKEDGEDNGDEGTRMNFENGPTTLALDGAGLGKDECKEGDHDHRQKSIDCSTNICLPIKQLK